MNMESTVKLVPFVGTRIAKHGNIFNQIKDRLGTAYIFSFKTDNFKIGREYYVIRNQFETNQRAEIWIDKETGLTLREIDFENQEIRFPETDITREVRDTIIDYNYEFDTVTDEDVNIPDLSEYEINYLDDKDIFNEQG